MEQTHLTPESRDSSERPRSLNAILSFLIQFDPQVAGVNLFYFSLPPSTAFRREIHEI